MDSDMVRGKPLSKEETKALLALIESSTIIWSKTTNASNNKMKSEEWVRLTNTFNATATTCRRTPQQLRLKWENLKKNSRKRSTRFTGGGPGEYIPPDDILDKVSTLLGSTGCGFSVPFGGDKDPHLLAGGSDSDGEGSLEGSIGIVPNRNSSHCFNSPLISMSIDNKILPMSNDNGGSSSLLLPLDNSVSNITLPIDSGIVVSESEKPGDTATKVCQDTPKRLTLFTPRTGKKKMKGDAKMARNLAIAEYYITKKKCIEAQLQNILFKNENLKIENEKLKLELSFLKK